MSPDPAARLDALTSFPRVSGDEPRAAAAGWFMTAFSPRERG